jgi:hypothetical protein
VTVFVNPPASDPHAEEPRSRKDDRLAAGPLKRKRNASINASACDFQPEFEKALVHGGRMWMDASARKDYNPGFSRPGGKQHRQLSTFTKCLRAAFRVPVSAGDKFFAHQSSRAGSTTARAQPHEQRRASP